MAPGRALVPQPQSYFSQAVTLMKASRFSLTLLPIVTTTILTVTVMFPGRADAEQVIHSFAGGTAGYAPLGLIRGKDGTLYGATLLGGEYDNGTVFELTPPATPGGPWAETLLYSFSDAPDGSYPNGALIFDHDGNLWSTTQAGGAYNSGTVFELSPPTVSGGPWTEAVLYSFKDQVFSGGLLIGWEGSFYGVANYGGAFGDGYVFRLTKLESGAWREGMLHSFSGGSEDGSYPIGLTTDKAGNLYGTTYVGGANNTGTVFELSPPSVTGEPWTEAILYSFPVRPQQYPFGTSNLIFDGEGNLYGTASYGGPVASNCTNGCGTIFELSPVAGGGWTESLLYSFTGGDDGDLPDSLVLDPAGNLYGTAYSGGHVAKYCTYGCGTFFQLSPPSAPGGAWSETTLHEFRTGWEGKNDGYWPQGTLIFGKYGALYGTTEWGGTPPGGTVFSVHP